MQNKGLFKKSILIFACIFILVLVLSIYFSNINIENKVGYDISVKNLTK